MQVVNVGIRQEGRERPINVIDSGNSQIEISSAINKAYQKFREIIKDCKNHMEMVLLLKKYQIFSKNWKSIIN